MSVDFGDDAGDINSAEDVKTVTIAPDSGAVDHVTNLECLPTSALVGELTGARIGRPLIAANGEPMETHGEVVLECDGGEDGQSVASFAVTEVTRPLQSISRICDQGYEVLFTGKEAKVRDPKTGKTRTAGDVDFESVSQVAGWLSPVPGGVGPMTVAMLLRNTVDSALQE